MDGFELNKIMGATTGALAVFLAIHIVSSGVFGHGGHHGEEPQLAYALDVGETGGGGGEPEPETPLPVLLAAADASVGERVFKKCASCHNVEAGGPNGQGPALYGVVGRAIASHEGFDYSEALTSIDGVWDWEHLDAFLESPKDYAPGTAMSFRGLPKPEDRANLLAFLNQHGDTQAPLPPIEEVSVEAPADAEASDAMGEPAPEAGASGAEPSEEQPASE